jgi:hypothetical protein
MHKNATKCNETLSKWCKNKHGASKIMDTLETYQGTIIDMKEGTIKYQFPLKKVMEHFPRRKKKLLFDSILRENYELDASTLDIT